MWIIARTMLIIYNNWYLSNTIFLNSLLHFWKEITIFYDTQKKQILYFERNDFLSQRIFKNYVVDSILLTL